MADCHQLFRAFESAISPSVADLEDLLALRRRTRRAIAAACQRLGASISFHPQGSFRLLTAVRREGLDLDDAVLFRSSSLPAEPTVEQLHQLALLALRQAGFAAYPRVPCPRILHPGGIRMDLVLYLEHGDGRVSLAHRRDGWVPTHSSYFIGWFEGLEAAAAGQIRRLVKYLKFWAARVGSCKMPSGVALTILLGNHHRRAPGDDLALVRTLAAVLRHLEAGGGCHRPTPPRGEELLRNELGPVQIRRFLHLLRWFVRLGEEALAACDLESSIVHWRRLLGPRFGAPHHALTADLRAQQLRMVLEDSAPRAEADAAGRLELPWIVNPGTSSHCWTL